MTTFGKKKVNGTINNILALSKETEVLVTGVSLLDESGAVDVPASILEKIMIQVTKKKPNLTLMVIVAGTKECTGICYVPKTQVSLTAEGWLNDSGLPVVNPETVGLQGGTDSPFRLGVLECEYPLKMKDQINSQAFAVLKKMDLFQTDESDDELPEMDW